MTTVPGDTPHSIQSPRERRQRYREEMQADILEAARVVMREHGVAALSLRKVAQHMHMQAPSLYAYFPSKQALYDALYRSAIRLFMTYQDRGLERRVGFWDRLQARLEAYMRFAEEQPDLYQLALERPVPGFAPSDESFEESRQVLAEFEQELAEAVESGEIAPDVTLTQARNLVTAMTHGLASQHLANEPQLPVGSGRYGSLIPAAIALFRAAWPPPHRTQERRQREPEGQTVGDE